MRKLLYLAVIIICVGIVIFKAHIITEHQKKEIISIAAEWERNGKPVAPLTVAKRDVVFTTKVSGIMNTGGNMESYVTADIASDLREGQKFDVYYGYEGGLSVPGRVTFVSRKMDILTGLYSVRLKTSGIPPEELKNKIAVAYVQTDVLKNVIALPNESIFMDNGRRYCWIIKDGKAERRYIETGRSNETHTVLKRGVKVGEILAAKGGYFLEEGDNVCLCPDDDTEKN